jgi:hypothetical protein
MYLLEVDMHSKMPATAAITNIILDELEKIQINNSQHDNSYDSTDVYQVCVNIKLKHLKHPLRNLDEFEILSEKWGNILRINPQVR